MFEMLKEKVHNVDPSLVSAIDEVIDTCAYYVDRVAAMENALESARFRLEGQDYRDRIADLDRQRRVVHDDLISKVNMSLRLAGKVAAEHPFTGDVDDRQQVADFAKKISDFYYDNRKRVKS